MTIPPQLSALINQVNQALNQLEEEVQQALQLIRPQMSLLRGNASLIRAFSTLNNAQLFVSVRRSQVERLVNRVLPEEVTGDIIQEVGEDLGTFLGEVFEVQELVASIRRQLEGL